MTKPTGKRPPDAKAKTGRLSKYRAEFARMARVFCGGRGATDAQLAELFDVTETTVNNWKREHPAFRKALEAKGYADEEVVESLFRGAVGYDYEEEVATYDAKRGEWVKTTVLRHEPGNATKQVYWTKNRLRDRFRDKQEIEHEAGESLAALAAAAFGKKP